MTSQVTNRRSARDRKPARSSHRGANKRKQGGSATARSARLQRQYKERLSLVGTFAAGFAHELTNPISSIEASADYALGTTDSERRQSLLRAIVADCARCRRKIESLSRFMATGMLEKRSVDLAVLVQRSIEMAKTEEAQLSPKVAIHSSARKISCDPIALEQVIANILKNAARAARDPCIAEITARRVGNHIRITCRDYGPGMKPDQLLRIFDPFYSTWRRRGGMGLGLTIARSLVEASGGRMKASSQLGSGSTFVVDLPITARRRRMSRSR